MRSRFRAWIAGARAWFDRYSSRLKNDRWGTLFELATILALLASFGAFLYAWWGAYERALTDPNLQTDDARTALFAFHRYAKGAPLAHDPIANEMIQYQPHIYRLIFWVTVPFMGLLAASKVAQALCILILAVGAGVLAKSRRAGLGTGLLFLFLFLRDGFVMNRIGGGLPRSFGFPAIGLWLAGALAHSARTRRAGAVVAALTYPSALAMVLGAEGLYTLRRLGRPSFRTSLRRIKHYLLLVAACAALFSPTALLATDGGPVHTLEQAYEEPAFGKAGRLWVLPLTDTGTAFGKQLLTAFKASAGSPLPKAQDAVLHWDNEVMTLFLVALLAVPLIGLSPVPTALICFFGSILALYAMSIFFAFRLYSPERYYSFGVRVAAIAWVVSTLGLLLPRLRKRLRAPLRNLAAAAVIFMIWSWAGTGAPSRGAMAMTINYHRHARLWEFIHGLPMNVRIASFITDGDDIPLFAQRANNGGYETLQPWLTLSWAREKARAEDTLRAFYATDQREVIDYAHKYHVTHLLVNRSRYRGDFVRRALTFEPLSSFARNLLEGRRPEQLVLGRVPGEAVIFRHESFLLVSVALLEQQWGH